MKTDTNKGYEPVKVKAYHNFVTTIRVFRHPKLSSSLSLTMVRMLLLINLHIHGVSIPSTTSASPRSTSADELLSERAGSFASSGL